MNNLKLLKQYADTGAILSQYQLDKLSPGLQNSYIRRRILQAQESDSYKIYWYEEQYCPEEYQEKLKRDRFENGRLLPEEYLELSEEERMYYIAEKGGILTAETFNESSEEIKVLFATQRMGHPAFNLKMFNYLPKKQRLRYLEYKSRHSMPVKIYAELTDDEKVFFLTNQSINRTCINHVFMFSANTTQELLDKAFMGKLKADRLLHHNELKKASVDVQIAHLDKLITNGGELSRHEYFDLHPKARDYFHDNEGYLE
jgi:hypothetical protein